jgi:hypothetical protein
MTHDAEQKAASIEGLERLIDVFGADRARWPARDRLRFSGLIADSAVARRMLAEAEALEAVLDRAPEPDAARVAALTDRIMAAAAGHRAVARPVLPGPAKVAPALRRVESPRLIDWPAAALLAASLVLGIMAGTAGYAVEPLQSITGLASAELAQESAVAEDAALAPFSDEEEVL